MALRYEFSWDIAAIGNVAVKFTDAGGTVEFQYTSGTYAHTDISSVVASHTAFADKLETDLNANATLSGTYTVTWSGTTGYTISASGTANMSFAFTTVATAAEGTRMRQILGFSGNQTGALTYSSDVRPYFLIIPAIQGRSGVRESEPQEIAMEDVPDDGDAELISKFEGDDDTADDGEILYDWRQAFEVETAPSSFSSEGTYVYKRQATSAVPWSYQHAFKHVRRAYHPFLVIDGSEQAVCKIRADGASFEPARAGGEDLPYWTIPFKTRLLGRL